MLTRVAYNGTVAIRYEYVYIMLISAVAKMYIYV